MVPGLFKAPASTHITPLPGLPQKILYMSIVQALSSQAQTNLSAKAGRTGTERKKKTWSRAVIKYDRTVRGC